ncbi:MAG: protein kinase, partial [Thermoanaerobaculia bacterium]|nr:protein kinase [Thermoanaerobaculia bacterium]
AKLREHDGTEAMGFHPQTSLTQEGLAIGTLAYMAPEQLRMLPTDPRADIFSLGVVLYEMATGHCPFRGQSTAEVISAILRDTPPRAFEQNDVIPPEVDAILRRCLEKEPAKRFGSAVEVRDDLAEVARAVDLGQPASRVTRSPSTPVRIATSRYARFAAAALAIVLLGAGVFAWRTRVPAASAAGTASPIAAQLPSLVVLPLSNFSDEPEYFVDGMTDALISALARIEGVRVISRQSAMHYKGSTKLLPQIARELGVDFVVEGSVARVGETVRLNTQVIQADPEATLWSESFERAAADVLALQNTFASAIASAIHVQVSPVEQSRLAATKSIDPDAYEAYLQGRYYGNQFSEEALRKAQGYFERAVAKDPSFAPAWVGLADTLMMLGSFHSDERDAIDNAGAAASKAVMLDPNLADGHAALSEVSMNRLDWAAAERQISRALELNPNSALARRRHWMLLSCLLRLDESQGEAEAAMRLDPLSAKVAADLGIQHLFRGDHAGAVRALHSALELDKDYNLAHVYLWMTYHEMGQDPQRGDELRYYLADLGEPKLLPQYDERLRASGYASALRWVALELDRQAVDRPYAAGVVAGLLAAAGEKDKAIAWLEKGVNRRSWEMAWLAVSPDYKPLRDMPEFRGFLRKLGLPTTEG